MIHTMILACILNAHDIPDTLDDAYGAVVTGMVGTDRADLFVRYHHTLAAILHIITEMIYRRREMMHVF
jgi:hypothetical protein